MPVKHFYGIMYNPFTDNLQFLEHNFTYDVVSSIAIIPADQQMIVRDILDITGTLVIEGRLILEV